MKNIASVWAQRAHAELGAEKKFGQLSEQLVDLEAGDTIIKMARNAQKDEARHAIMCALVAKEYGHSSGFEPSGAPVATTPNSWGQRKSARERLLCEITLMCCIIESVNASLLNSIYGNSQKGETRKIIHQILKDEVKHGQIGWAYLASESKKGELTFLGDYLPEMLDVAVKDELFLPIPEDLKDENTFDYGVMPVGLRLRQFWETVNHVVFPGFEKFGIETLSARSWLQGKML